MDMTWSLSVGAFILGLLIFIAGGAMVAFHQKLADTMMGGVSDYKSVKIAGLVVILLGIIIMFNLHKLLLMLFVNLIFRH